MDAMKAPPAAVDVVIMAAGKGTRMKSRLPKVLHPLGGRPLLAHVMAAAAALAPRRLIVVTGHDAERVARAAHGFAADQGVECHTVLQAPQRGTGHAVQQALPLLPEDGICLVLNGDVPLIAPSTLQALVQACGGQQLALLTAVMADPTGYGRVLRQGAAVEGIVEHKDATEAQRRIDEVYTGFMAAPSRLLRGWLGRLTHHNAQGEYYLTDVVGLAVADGVAVTAQVTPDPVEVDGVNSPLQLASLERAYQMRQAQALMEQGVRLADPARLDVRGRLTCGSDVEIDINCLFEGEVRLGDGVRIGAHCVIAQAQIEDGAVILPYTHIDGDTAGVRVGAGARIGPFARLRPGTVLGDEVHIGNFVEVKNSTLGHGAKANHLAYLGDATVGERVNFGAGAITANYDGANKHRTTLGDDVHVGSNCVLVAPVTLGAGSTVGAGSTLTKDIPPGALAVARGKQVQVAGWQRPTKKKS